MICPKCKVDINEAYIINGICIWCKNNLWTEKHITEGKDEFGRIIYYGWDETGADTVCVSENKQEVVKALVDYSNRLNRRRNV